MSRAKAPHHQGTHQARARRITRQANANPDTQCWRCGRTQAQHGRRWVSGHIIDGLIDGPEAAECEECNAREGGRRGAMLNQQRANPTSEPL